MKKLVKPVSKSTTLIQAYGTTEGANGGDCSVVIVQTSNCTNCPPAKSNANCKN